MGTEVKKMKGADRKNLFVDDLEVPREVILSRIHSKPYFQRLITASAASFLSLMCVAL